MWPDILQQDKENIVIKINQVKVPILSNNRIIKQKTAKILGIKEQDIKDFQILRHSIDARKEQVFDVYQVALSCGMESRLLQKESKKKAPLFSKYEPVRYDFWARCKKQNEERKKLVERPVIIGAGPAGYFCGLMLAEHGYRPIIIERGKKVEERQQDVYEFFENGKLIKNSNVQFGEGGAGAFSDGKLNTLVKDQEGRSRKVLETFVKYGAYEDILYEQKPHVGTDVLHEILIQMREDYESMGGEILFGEKVVEFLTNGNELVGVKLENGKVINTKVCVLAIGHSARDTFEVLSRMGIEMLSKSFAVGFRVEHPQEQINQSQYGEKYPEELSAAPYKVTATSSSGRGVYSFCMCPGGYVVNASSEEDALAVNGMSYHARDGKNANSAIIVAVTPEDYPDKTALAGVHFQENVEKKAFELGNGKIPQQLFGDFEKDVASTEYGEYKSETKGETTLTNIRHLLPEELSVSFIEGMHIIGKKMKNFDREDAILSGIESRTSSPVRITRDEAFESTIKGIYPCGEGAGYAGGIMSAAMDGIKVAEQIAAKYEPFALDY